MRKENAMETSDILKQRHNSGIEGDPFPCVSFGTNGGGVDLAYNFGGDGVGILRGPGRADIPANSPPPEPE